MFSSILVNICAQTYTMNNGWPPINVIFGGSKKKFQRQALCYNNLYGKDLSMFFYSTLSVSGMPTSIL
jgi:hypothetical protein